MMSGTFQAGSNFSVSHVLLRSMGFGQFWVGSHIRLRNLSKFSKGILFELDLFLGAGNG